MEQQLPFRKSLFDRIKEATDSLNEKVNEREEDILDIEIPNIPGLEEGGFLNSLSGVARDAFLPETERQRSNNIDMANDLFQIGNNTFGGITPTTYDTQQSKLTSTNKFLGDDDAVIFTAANPEGKRTLKRSSGSRVEVLLDGGWTDVETALSENLITGIEGTGGQSLSEKERAEDNKANIADIYNDIEKFEVKLYDLTTVEEYNVAISDAYKYLGKGADAVVEYLNTDQGIKDRLASTLITYLTAGKVLQENPEATNELTSILNELQNKIGFDTATRNAYYNYILQINKIGVKAAQASGETRLTDEDAVRYANAAITNAGDVGAIQEQLGLLSWEVNTNGLKHREWEKWSVGKTAREKHPVLFTENHWDKIYGEQWANRESYITEQRSLYTPSGKVRANVDGNVAVDVIKEVATDLIPGDFTKVKKTAGDAVDKGIDKTKELLDSSKNLLDGLNPFKK